MYTRLTQAVTSTQPPTNTPQPTETTTATSIPPTLVPTRTFVVTQAPTLSPTQTAFQCSITSLAPTSGTNLPKGTDFDLAVSLKNTGTEAWSSNVIDFKYISGSKFQKKVDMIDLPADVAPGGSINLVIDMTAGTDAGSLNTTWELSQSNALFCPVSMYVYVQ